MDSYKIVWDDALLIGSEDVDNQHKRLIELMATIPDYPTENDAAVLNEVLEYAVTHFADEEAVMTKIGYPELRKHQSEHKRLTRTLLVYKKEYENGDTDLYSFKQFMFRWVRDHIMDEDKKIGEFIKSSGKG